jgi:hypothetical protein
MSTALPAPIARYFATDRNDSDALASCFTEDAVVTDEGRTHTGRAAVRAWKAASASQFTYTYESVTAQERDGKILVTSRVVGDFPGSPIDLHYVLALRGDAIASLEITP